MNRIEVAVQEQFAALAAGQVEPQPVVAATASLPSRTSASSRNANTADVPTPFASVDQVIPDSPASEAGLQVGDKIVQFGTANWLNHDNMRKVAEVVEHNEGVSLWSQTMTFAKAQQRPVPVRVLRDGSIAQLQLTPRREWGGRGLLGCHIVRIERDEGTSM
jgi:26S proteasome regulatory subunit N4